jgi:hypothetical protein
MIKIPMMNEAPSYEDFCAMEPAIYDCLERVTGGVQSRTISLDLRLQGFAAKGPKGEFFCYYKKVSDRWAMDVIHIHNNERVTLEFPEMKVIGVVYGETITAVVTQIGKMPLKVEFNPQGRLLSATPYLVKESSVPPEWIFAAAGIAATRVNKEISVIGNHQPFTINLPDADTVLTKEHYHEDMVSLGCVMNVLPSGEVEFT